MGDVGESMVGEKGEGIVIAAEGINKISDVNKGVNERIQCGFQSVEGIMIKIEGINFDVEIISIRIEAIIFELKEFCRSCLHFEF